MNKVREEHVRARFVWRMARDLPEFRPAKFGNSSRNLVCFRAKSVLWTYVTLDIAKNSDQFAVILTWMLTDRPPVYATPGTPRGEPNRDGLSVDLSLLWSPGARPWKVKYLPPRDALEAWSRSHPEVDMSDEDLVKSYFYTDDAVDKLLELGIPYLNEAERKYGGARNGDRAGEGE
ncbi:MAG: hypothetical protein P4L84_07480 [Isosphaeraceae bacterium]|nr:hypothetical protein [Isosphaeraceae bacterium]